MRKLAPTETGHEQGHAAGEHLVGRRDQSVARCRKTGRQKCSECPGEGRDEEHDRADRIDRPVQPSGHNQNGNAHKAEQHPSKQIAADTLAAHHPVDDDPERDRCDDQSGHSRRDGSLGEDHETVRHRQHEDPDHCRTPQLTPRDTEIDAPRCEPAGEDHAGEEKAKARVQKRRERLDGDRDGEIRRAPDHVHDGEGQPNVQARGTRRLNHVRKT